MCGLLTFLSAAGDASRHRAAVAGALGSLAHRGPDETGVVVVGEDVVLGFRRLSVIDLAGSSQPLPNADRYLLVFNGEIYNYVELREELAREHGATFATEGE